MQPRYIFSVWQRLCSYTNLKAGLLQCVELNVVNLTGFFWFLPHFWVNLTKHLKHIVNKRL